MTRLLPAIAPIPALFLPPAPTAADTRFARLSQSSIVAIVRHAHAMPIAATVPTTEYISAVNRAPVSLSEGAELAPIPVEEGVISLSAILLGDNYFDALRHMRRVIDDISLLYERILIPIKARAFLDLAQRRANGESVDARHIRKQRADLFRLTQLLPGEGSLALADSMRADLGEFLGQALGDPGLDYAALRLPFTLDDATAILGRYYRLESSG